MFLSEISVVRLTDIKTLIVKVISIQQNQRRLYGSSSGSRSKTEDRAPG